MFVVIVYLISIFVYVSGEFDVLFEEGECFWSYFRDVIFYISFNVGYGIIVNSKIVYVVIELIDGS